MKTIPLSEAKAKLSSLLDSVEGHDEEIVITRNGRAAAVLVSPGDFESWKETVAVRSDADLVAEIPTCSPTPESARPFAMSWRARVVAGSAASGSSPSRHDGHRGRGDRPSSDHLRGDLATSAPPPAPRLRDLGYSFSSPRVSSSFSSSSSSRPPVESTRRTASLLF